MGLRGKGWFIWQIPRCEGGVASAIASKAAIAGCTHVLIKVAHRAAAFGLDRDGRDLVPEVVDALRGRGIQAWGWHYVYGSQPEAEAAIAVQRCAQLKLSGYVVDAEQEFKMPGMAAPARVFMQKLRAGLPSVPIALSSYRYPSLHREFPWKAFLEKSDLAMPQVYWEMAHNPDQQLARSVKEYSDAGLVGAPRPVVPTGSAYGSNGWLAAPAEVTAFLQQAVALQLEAANLYSWDYATSAGNTGLWDATAAFEWPAPAGEDIVDRYIAALSAGDLSQVLSVYQASAAHVTAARTAVGVDKIRLWYQDLLLHRLPGAQFTLVERSGTGSSRHFRWQAQSPAGSVMDGSDTLGLRDGLIQYHYTHFTIRSDV
jgi:hypothetical protein